MNIGIIGSGTMGAGIALAFAKNCSCIVYLCDLNQDLAHKAKNSIMHKLEKLTKRNVIDTQQAEDIVNRITTGTIDCLTNCELVIEAIPERMDLKQELFSKLQKICRKDTIFASNTSSLSITEMANGLDRTVVGMHFFNPADIMSLVEVISGVHTPEYIVDRIFEISKKIGKTPVRVNESAGFVVNRILIPMINEAIGIYSEGTASAADIDTAMKLGANHPIGPLALADLIGLDVCLAIMEVLQSETGEDKYRAHPLLRKMVRGELLGRKNGEGFYKY